MRSPNINQIHANLNYKIPFHFYQNRTIKKSNNTNFGEYVKQQEHS